jgi:hypothetical protein
MALNMIEFINVPLAGAASKAGTLSTTTCVGKSVFMIN